MSDQNKERKMGRERILMALVGGTGGNDPVGLLMDGYCLALAATDGARGWIEATGEDEVGSWLEGAGIDPPGAGGLWVLECDLDDGLDEDGNEPEFPALGDWSWRCALPDEIAGLIERQSYRANRQTPGNPPATDGRWTFLGALV